MANIGKQLEEIRNSTTFKFHENIYEKLAKNRTKRVKTSSVLQLLDSDFKESNQEKINQANENTEELIIEYFKNSITLVKSLAVVIQSIRQGMKELIQDEVNVVDKDYVISILILVFVLIISPLIILLVKNVVSALQIFSRSVKKKASELRIEKKNAEIMIYQMLPKSVADNLKGGKQTSEEFDSVTICFIEVDGFSAIVRKSTPLQIFDLLNTVYKAYDSRMDFYDVFKVESINDNYMVASGVPVRNGDKHPREIANLCIDLIFMTPTIIVNHDINLRIKIR